jgi:hypothetical protein
MEAQNLLERLNYHRYMVSSRNAINNLQKLNPRLGDENILTHAFLASNTALTEDERKIYMECLKVKAMTEYEMYKREIERIEARKAQGELTDCQL